MGLCGKSAHNNNNRRAPLWFRGELERFAQIKPKARHYETSKTLIHQDLNGRILCHRGVIGICPAILD